MIEVAEYDPEWPARFAAARDALAQQLEPWLVGDIEHVGSTAVPGLAAKPVIDIMAPVRDLETSRTAIALLADAGWCHAPYKQDVMHWFCRPSPEHRTHHLHIVPFGSALWWQRIAFRDVLRADAALADRYAALKRDLAARYADDREAYTDGKTAFIAAAIRTSAL